MKEKIRRKVPEGELCAVCSDLATGYHYGVASCNGCKTFFRRTIVSEHSFVCQYQGNCDVNKNIRCACRHCRFNKCVAVGMDAKAIQNDRDRIGPTKKMKVQKRSSSDEDWSMSPQRPFDDKIIEHLRATESLCNQLRGRVLPAVESVRQVITSNSLIFNINDLPVDPDTVYNELYPASMIDIQMWNKRELRLCLEWVKTFEEFQKLVITDQMALVHNFAFTFNILNRVYYSQNAGPDKIVYPNGAYILRQPQEQVRIPGCRSIYHRQMDEIMIPFRQLEIDMTEFAAFKASIFFNPDAMDLTPEGKIVVQNERLKYLAALFHLITAKIGVPAGAQRYGTLLMMTASIQNIIAQNDENMQVMEVFQSSWRIDRFVKELCMKVP
uniref:Nuclear receptor domain-containing protein n=1 Tax=Steinernema glaseri TaxID=37863 RepID=A0A1I7ZUN6_9BILA